MINEKSFNLVKAVYPDAYEHKFRDYFRRTNLYGIVSRNHVGFTITTKPRSTREAAWNQAARDVQREMLRKLES